MHDHDDRDGATRGGTDDRANAVLPVTAEVGGEGGSYADPTLQVPTFHGPVADIDRPAGAASVAGEAIRFDDVAAGGVGASPDPAHGMLRYPSEDPASPPAVNLASSRGLNWRGGVIGAV